MNINEYMIEKSYKPRSSFEAYCRSEGLDPLYIRAARSIRNIAAGRRHYAASQENRHGMVKCCQAE